MAGSALALAAVCCCFLAAALVLCSWAGVVGRGGVGVGVGVGIGVFVGCLCILRAFLRRLRPLAPVLLSYVAGGGAFGVGGGVLGNGGKPGGGSTLRGGVGATLRDGIGSTLRGGVGSTLRGGAGMGDKVGAAVGLVGADGGGVGDTMLVSNVVRSSSAWTWLSVRGANGELFNGLLRASIMSCIPARTRSVEEASGMVTLVGNQAMVSQMCSRRVSHIHILKQR